MASNDIQSTLTQLQSLSASNLSNATQLLSKAKLQLLHLNALVPTTSSSPQHLIIARQVFETGALIAVRQRDQRAIARYYQQLQPFYTSSSIDHSGSQQSKITGLYLLSLLSQGEYASFHTEVESLQVRYGSREKLEQDVFVRYPLQLEQAFMEGSYDKVWNETAKEKVPCEGYSIFSEVLINTIRAEIASCSERAYASLPISNAKSLLFLDSEGAVLEFARGRGWVAQDGRLYFPAQHEEQARNERDVLATSGQVIENTLGYARQLETIV